MIKLIVGTKGSGKTKAMIDQINDAVKTSKGNVVVVEKGMKLTYDIAPAARLIDLEEYKISGGEMLYGFVAGLMASNYDITDLYIDGILKVLDHDINRLGVVLDEMAAIAGDSVFHNYSLKPSNFSLFNSPFIRDWCSSSQVLVFVMSDTGFHHDRR